VYDLINHGVPVHRARQWDVEAKAPHIIILATDEGNGHYAIWKVYTRGNPPPLSSGLEAVDAVELVRL